jgi:hypothetical protein
MLSSREYSISTESGKACSFLLESSFIRQINREVIEFIDGHVSAPSSLGIGEERMRKKLVCAVLLTLVLTNVISALSVIPPVSGRILTEGHSAKHLEIMTLENVIFLDDYTIQVKILMNASSPQLAELYRRTFSSPLNASVGEEMPIPENTTSKIEDGQNATDVSIPIRNDFYKSVLKEQLLSLGLSVEVFDSKMIPLGQENEFIISMECIGSPVNMNVTTIDSGQMWDIGVGPFNTTGITGLFLTKIMLTQMMLDSLQGEYLYHNSWQTRFELPVGSTLLNSFDLEGRRWSIDFGGGTYFYASVSLDGESIVVVDEDFFISKNSVAANPEYLVQSLSNYKVFTIRCSLPYSPSGNSTIIRPASPNTNFQFYEDTGWLPLPDIHWSYSYEDALGNASAYANLDLTISPQFRFSMWMGWQFYADWHFPFIHLDKLWAHAKFETRIDVRFEANATLMYDRTWPLYKFKISYPLPGIPGWVDVVFTIDTNLHIEGTMSFVAKATVRGKLDAGIQWTSRGIGWERIYEPMLDGSITDFDWQLAIGISVTPSISFRLALLFYSVAGPYVEFKLFVTIEEITVLSNDTISWHFWVGFDINAGITLQGTLRSILGLGDWEWPLYGQTIWEWNGSWSPNSTSPIERPTHDLSIVDFASSPPIIFTDTIADLNVTIRNVGTFNETSDVTILQNDAVVGTLTDVFFVSGGYVSLNFTWSTVGLSPSNYTLEAVVKGVTNETQIEDNVKNLTVYVVKPNDISLLDVAVHPDKTYPGRIVNVTVDVKNQGELVEDFNLTIYSNDTEVQTRFVQGLRPSEEVVLLFEWNATGAPGSFWIIWATCDTVHYDMNITSNTFINNQTTVMVKFLGDVNGNGKVDMYDISLIAMAFGASPGNSRWTPETDINGDNKIDLIDVAITSKNFGR